jgi:drug/metabolite transporter (DMT)-like permease
VTVPAGVPGVPGGTGRPAWMAHVAVVLAAVIFGSTFIVVKDAIKHVRPVPFLAARFLIGAAALGVVDRFRGIGRGPGRLGRAAAPGGLGRAGLVAGLVLLGGYVFQTVGLQYTTTSVSAFVTYLLVVLVPLLSALILRHVPSVPTVAGVVMATTGLFLLTGKGLALGRGEVLTLGCALCFALHILVLNHAAPRFDGLRLNAVQLAVVGAACGIPGLWLGGYDFTLAAWLAAIYTGVTASGIALGLQIWGQRQVGPTRTSLLLMIEPVSAGVIGALIGDHLGWAGVAGAGLILGGIAAAELGPLALTSRSARLAAAAD